MDALTDVAEEPESPPPIKLMMQVASETDVDRPVKLFLDVEQPTPVLSPKVPQATIAHIIKQLKQEVHLAKEVTTICRTRITRPARAVTCK